MVIINDDHIKDIIISLINNGKIANYTDTEKNAKDVVKAIKILKEKLN